MLMSRSLLPYPGHAAPSSFSLHPSAFPSATFGNLRNLRKPSPPRGGITMRFPARSLSAFLAVNRPELSGRARLGTTTGEWPSRPQQGSNGLRCASWTETLYIRLMLRPRTGALRHLVVVSRYTPPVCLGNSAWTRRLTPATLAPCYEQATPVRGAVPRYFLLRRDCKPPAPVGLLAAIRYPCWRRRSRHQRCH
jgi:hypothetical protein